MENRFIKILLALAALAGLALAAGAAGKKDQGPKGLTILHVNDTHSHFEPLRSGEEKGMGGVIERAAFVDSVRKADGADKVLLLHAGDFSQGTSYFTKLHGDLEIDVLNAMGYDAVCLGNHEFDNGVEELARRLKKLNMPVVCANYDFSSFELGKYVKPYTIVYKAGMKIGIFGLLTDITRTVSRTVSDRIPRLDSIEEAQRWASYLKNEEKCDLVIALTHIGYDSEDLTDPLLVRSTRGIDLVIGGHSHSFLDSMKFEYNLDGLKVPIVQDGCWGLYIGEIKL